MLSQHYEKGLNEGRLHFTLATGLYFSVSRSYACNISALDMQLVAFGNLDTLSYLGFKQANVFNINITCP